MLKTFLVNENKIRLDRFIADNFPDVSRSRVQKDIEAGLVKVNGETVLEGKTVVRLDDKIEYVYEEEKPLQPQEINLKVLYENEDILIIDKEPGLVVHPAPGYKGITLVEGLLHRYKDIAKVGEEEIRPGIVHRLDKETSGVMLVAKSQKAFEHLKNAFATRSIKKEYVALLCGRLSSKHGFINTPIGRHQTDFRKMTTLRPKEAKEAITEYNIIEYLTNPAKSGAVDEYTLVRVKLHTGRTHQIRVHFQSIGFPLAGDSLYGKCKLPGLSRQFLHAQKIEVKLPDGTWIEAQAKIPEDLKSVLKNLNLKSEIDQLDNI